MQALALTLYLRRRHVVHLQEKKYYVLKMLVVSRVSNFF